MKPHLDKWIFTYLVDLYLCQMYIYSIELYIIITASALILCNLSGRAKEIQRQWIKYKLCLSLAFITLYRVVYIPFKIYFDNEHFIGCGAFL